MSIYRPVCVACQKSLGIMTGIEEVAMQVLDEHYAEKHPGLVPGEGGDFDVEVPSLLPLQPAKADRPRRWWRR